MKIRQVTSVGVVLILGIIIFSAWQGMPSHSIVTIFPKSWELSVYVVQLHDNEASTAQRLIDRARNLSGVPELRGEFMKLSNTETKRKVSQAGEASFRVHNGTILIGSFDKAHAYLKLISVKDNGRIYFGEDDCITFGSFPNAKRVPGAGFESLTGG